MCVSSLPYEFFWLPCLLCELSCPQLQCNVALGRVKIDEVGGAGRFKWHMVNKIAEVNISPKINISSRTPEKALHQTPVTPSPW